MSIIEDLGELIKNTDYISLEYHSEEDRRSIDHLLGDFTLLKAHINGPGCGVLNYAHTELTQLCLKQSQSVVNLNS